MVKSNKNSKKDSEGKTVVADNPEMSRVLASTPGLDEKLTSLENYLNHISEKFLAKEKDQDRYRSDAFEKIIRFAAVLYEEILNIRNYNIQKLFRNKVNAFVLTFIDERMPQTKQSPYILEGNIGNVFSWLIVPTFDTGRGNSGFIMGKLALATIIEYIEGYSRDVKGFDENKKKSCKIWQKMLEDSCGYSLSCFLVVLNILKDDISDVIKYSSVKGGGKLLEGIIPPLTFSNHMFHKNNEKEEESEKQDSLTSLSAVNSGLGEGEEINRSLEIVHGVAEQLAGAGEPNDPLASSSEIGVQAKQAEDRNESSPKVQVDKQYDEEEIKNYLMALLESIPAEYQEDLRKRLSNFSIPSVWQAPESTTVIRRLSSTNVSEDSSEKDVSTSGVLDANGGSDESPSPEPSDSSQVLLSTNVPEDSSEQDVSASGTSSVVLDSNGRSDELPSDFGIEVDLEAVGPSRLSSNVAAQGFFSPAHDSMSSSLTIKYVMPMLGKDFEDKVEYAENLKLDRAGLRTPANIFTFTVDPDNYKFPCEIDRIKDVFVTVIITTRSGEEKQVFDNEKMQMRKATGEKAKTLGDKAIPYFAADLDFSSCAEDMTGGFYKFSVNYLNSGGKEVKEDIKFDAQAAKGFEINKHSYLAFSIKNYCIDCIDRPFPLQGAAQEDYCNRSISCKI